MDTFKGSTKVSTILANTQSESYSEWTTEPTSTTTTTARRDFNIKGTSTVLRCRFQILPLDGDIFHQHFSLLFRKKLSRQTDMIDRYNRQI